MKALKIALGLIGLLGLLVSPAIAANDIDMEGGIIRIGTIDGTAWTWTDTVPDAANGIYIWKIIFSPGATGDVVTVQWKDADGIEILEWTAADIYDRLVFYGDPAKQYKLYIDFPDLNDDALLIIHTR